MNKYRAVKTTVDGITFDSKKEAKRYGELKQLEKAGEIANLETQPKFTCIVGGEKICDYRADFSYSVVGSCRFVVEDVKSAATRKDRVYRLKKKLVEALHPITIQEV